MGLFQKTKPGEKSKDEFHNYVDNLLKDSSELSNEDIDEKFSVENMTLNSKYSIDHVVALMRDLPSDASDIVVATVTKTLESAGINVQKIVEDARNKETALTAQIEDLNREIDALKKQIADKKEQISVSTAVLEETRRVRGLLESAKSDKAGVQNKTDSADKNPRGSKLAEKETREDPVSETEAVELALKAQ